MDAICIPPTRSYDMYASFHSKHVPINLNLHINFNALITSKSVSCVLSVLCMVGFACKKEKVAHRGEIVFKA